MTDKADSKPGKPDEELDELLDSALDDFDKVAMKDSAVAMETKQDGDVDDPPMETLWNDEFIAQQAKMFEKQMSEIFGAGNKDVTPEQLNLGFQRIAEAAALAVDPAQTELPQVDPAFTQSIADVLKGLSQGQENIQQQSFSEEAIAGMFGNINLNESGENNAFLPFMQGMMQSLLSAEVLLPSLKEIVSKYPGWLEENGSKIAPEEKTRFESQLQLMQEVCAELEKEKTDDSADVKKDRFTIVLDKMQRMQDLGQPPEDLVGAGAENIMLPNLGEGAMPTGEQCSIM